MRGNYQLVYDITRKMCKLQGYWRIQNSNFYYIRTEIPALQYPPPHLHHSPFPDYNSFVTKIRPGFLLNPFALNVITFSNSIKLLMLPNAKVNKKGKCTTLYTPLLYVYGLCRSKIRLCTLLLCMYMGCAGVPE